MTLSSLLPSTLAFLDIEPRMIIAIVIPLAGIILGGVITVSAMYFHNQRREMWHQTARLALEKGQPLPPLTTEDLSHKSPQTRTGLSGDFRAGLILVAVGAGLYLFLSAVGGTSARFIGAIPGFIGIALLIYAFVDTKYGKKNVGGDDRSNPA